MPNMANGGTISATTARVQDRVSDLRGAGFDAAGIAADLTDAGAASGLVSAALGFSVFVSMFAGLYPASRAEKLDPVQALRHD